jgi:hypothetical protein
MDRGRRLFFDLLFPIADSRSERKREVKILTGHGEKYGPLEVSS